MNLKSKLKGLLLVKDGSKKMLNKKVVVCVSLIGVACLVLYLLFFSRDDSSYLGKSSQKIVEVKKEEFIHAEIQTVETKKHTAANRKRFYREWPSYCRQ